MALWEYKVITSGKGGFASATMLESFLNQLGKDEWEIIDFRTDPTNSLVFNGLARRPTQREWTLEAAVAAAAKAEADKLRAELMQKQHAGDATASADAPAGSSAGDKAAGPAGLRQLRDTDRDHDPEALAEEAAQTDDWSNLDDFEDDLPTFFDAIKPHLRKNQNAPGQSVALNYLAKRWEQPENDLHGALRECGFVIPEAETDAPVYLEYEGDLYWVEKNNRGQFFLNTREKPRPKFRVAAGKPLDPSDPAFLALAEEQAALEAERAKRAAEQAAREAEAAARRAEREAQRQAAEQARREQQAAAQAAREAARAVAAAANGGSTEGAAPAPAGDEQAASASAGAGAGNGSADQGFASASAPGAAAASAATLTPGVLPEGEALLDAIRPQMRRNRRGPGYSGSTAYLAKFFKVEEAALRSALAALGLNPPATQGDKAPQVAIGDYVYWVNKDGGGGLWINGRQGAPRDRAPGQPGSASAPAATAAAASDGASASAPEAAGGEPGVFRAVPRAMPPVPEPAASPESAPAAAAEPDAPASAPVETVPASVAASAAADSAPAGTPEPEASPARSAPAADEAAAPTGDENPEAETESDAETDADADAASEDEPAGEPGPASPLSGLRLVMKANKSKTGLSGSISFLAKALERSEEELLATLQGQGLVVPPETREGEEEPKPVFVELGGEIYWLSRFAKDGSLWLNAKPAKSATRRSSTGKAAARPRTKRRASSAIDADAAAEE